MFPDQHTVSSVVYVLAMFELWYLWELFFLSDTVVGAVDNSGKDVCDMFESHRG